MIIFLAMDKICIANCFYLLSIHAKTIVLVYFLLQYGFEPTPPPTPEEEESEEEQDEDEDGFAGGGHHYRQS